MSEMKKRRRKEAQNLSLMEKFVIENTIKEIDEKCNTNTIQDLSKLTLPSLRLTQEYQNELAYFERLKKIRKKPKVLPLKKKIVKTPKEEKNGFFNVESILKAKRDANNNIIECLVKWEGYDSDENTWEPIENLKNCEKLLHKFDSEEKNNLMNKEIEKPKTKILNKRKKRGFKGVKKIKLIELIKSETEKSQERSEMSNKEIKNSKIIEQTEKNKNISAQIENGKKSKEKSEMSNKENKNSKIIEQIDKNKSISAQIENGIQKIAEIQAELNNKPAINNIAGSFEAGDKPKKIFMAKPYENYIMCGVDWEPRNDNFQPQPSFFTNKEIRKHDPCLLLDFYESKIKFPAGGTGIKN